MIIIVRRGAFGTFKNLKLRLQLLLLFTFKNFIDCTIAWNRNNFHFKPYFSCPWMTDM